MEKKANYFRKKLLFNAIFDKRIWKRKTYRQADFNNLRCRSKDCAIHDFSFIDKAKVFVDKKGREPILEDLKNEQTFSDLANLKKKRKK